VDLSGFTFKTTSSSSDADVQGDENFYGESIYVNQSNAERDA
jgi:hypothetical protein